MIRFFERLFVWTGGAVFVGSIAATAWLYGRRFSAAADLRGWWPVAIDAALVAGFAIHHSLFAREPIKRAVARLLPERLLRSSYVWVASLLLLVVVAGWQQVGGAVYRLDGVAAWCMTAVQAAGLLMIAASVRAIHPLELAGIRTADSGEDLQVRGPYALVRHPLYLGWLLIVFAPAHLTGDRLAFAVLTTIYLIIAIPWEERSLERAFGAGYTRYRQRVRWRVVPYVY